MAHLAVDVDRFALLEHDRITMRAVSPLADFSFDYHDLLFTPARQAAR